MGLNVSWPVLSLRDVRYTNEIQNKIKYGTQLSLSVGRDATR